MRRPLIAGNWKMNGSLALVERFAQAFTTAELPAEVDIAFMLPAPYLPAAQRSFAGLPVSLGAQTLHPEPKGAYTGEISGAMLKEFGAHYVLVGHSERRSLFHEDDTAVLARVRAALQAGLEPVLCLGETLEEREAGNTESVVCGQLQAVIDAVGIAAFGKAVVAYEPVWAIGTGRTASPEQAQEVHASLRASLEKNDPDIAESLCLLYGGSVKADNAALLFAQSDIDGGLIGGASLTADSFIAICQAAE